jgi:hypothetical protein
MSSRTKHIFENQTVAKHLSYLNDKAPKNNVFDLN